MFSGIFRLPQSGKARRSGAEKALDLLSIFGMENMGNVKAGSLPYGAQQRTWKLSARWRRTRLFCCWTNPPRV